ncbi:MAG: transcription elongation factor GreA [Dehalococcoidia bacterium]|nr:MAG: transcription elongation factor GreA [Dehalococcoidia bacterium]
MSEKEIFLTPEGLAKLEEELEHLSTVRRQEVADKIQQAKELRSSVISPEYEEAKNEQGFVEGRILEIERIIKNATIIHHEDVNMEFVEVGNEVRVQLQDGSEEHYTIVGSAEANPGEWRISNESPMGEALLGKRVGDEVEVEAPAGLLKLRILEIK